MVVMGEGDIDDCWSLLAIVNESSRKAKTRAQLVINDNNPLKTATNSATTVTTNPQLDYIEMDHSSDHKSFFDDQFFSMNNSSGFWLPSAAEAVMTAPADDISSPEEDLQGPFLVPHKPPHVVTNNNSKAEPVVVAGGMASNHPLVEQNSRHHLPPRNFQVVPNQSPPAHVFRGRPRKKKFEDRRIVRLTKEELSVSDKWAWRKYGQKPIKGSPYPRNYYRCSSNKQCRAKKQVEQSPEESDIYIVTYSNYHHHPYPSTRNTPGPRVRFAPKPNPNPPPEVESPTNTVLGPRYKHGPVGTNGVIKIDDDHVAGDDSSFSSGEMNNNEGYIYSDADFQMPIMNSMTFPELLTDMKQLNGEGNCSGVTNTITNNNNNNNNNVGYIQGCDPNVKMGVRIEENGSGYGAGNRGMYAPAPATLVGAHQPPNYMRRTSQNVWDIEMIRKSKSFFS